MPPKPVLIFPSATIAARAALRQFPRDPPPRPSRANQIGRLTPRFAALDQQFGTVQLTTDGIDPEQVIVFETVGSAADFQTAVRRLPGLEWLADFDIDIATPDPGFLQDGSEVGGLSGHLFVIIGNRAAYRQLLQQWNTWTTSQNERLPRGFGSLAEVFKHLQDVRAWSPQDRIRTTGIVEYWEQGLASAAPLIHFEVELWCRHNDRQRTAAFVRLRDVVEEAKGRILHEAIISEIDYQAALVELPADAVSATLDMIRADKSTRLLRLTDVKYITPTASIRTIPQDLTTNQIANVTGSLPTEDPLVGLLDGLPLSNHTALQGRIVIDDPDDYAAAYNAGEHRHGTAMASLILHGEIGTGDTPSKYRLYVRPVLRPGPADFNGIRQEQFPQGQLIVDLVHRVIRRMFEGENTLPAQAPTVRVVNLSLGDGTQLFDRQISPWARLLDWLAWKYRILFVVSAGNHLDDITIPVPLIQIARLTNEALMAHTLRALATQRLTRRLLAPAESVNSLTIGALHTQATDIGTRGPLTDLLGGATIASPISSVTSGFRRSVKPEILVAGGVQHYGQRVETGDSATFELRSIANQPGQSVAAPGGTGIPPQSTARTCGTSNATALTSRAAHGFMEHLGTLRQMPGGEQLDDSKTAVLLKAMLVHGATWGSHQDIITNVFCDGFEGLERWRLAKRVCTQFLGYGAADFGRSVMCSDQRVVVLGTSDLGADEGHVYRLPLPTALNAQLIKRRLTVTLAWLTPFNPRHRNYAIADLWFDLPEETLQLKRVDADHVVVRRGTIQHEVLEGEAAVPIAANDTLPIIVSCRSEAGRLTDRIPYSLMVSLEVARPLGVDIHDEVRLALDRLRAPVVIRTAGNTL